MLTASLALRVNMQRCWNASADTSQSSGDERQLFTKRMDIFEQQIKQREEELATMKELMGELADRNEHLRAENEHLRAENADLRAKLIPEETPEKKLIGPLWIGTNDPVESEYLKKAEVCQLADVHQVGEWFARNADEFGWYEDKDDTYENNALKWYTSLSARIRTKHFQHLGLAALMHVGASYRFFRPDKNNVRLMCKHCHSLLSLTRWGEHFTEEDDFKLLAFLRLQPLKHPEVVSK